RLEAVGACVERFPFCDGTLTCGQRTVCRRKRITNCSRQTGAPAKLTNIVGELLERLAVGDLLQAHVAVRPRERSHQGAKSRVVTGRVEQVPGRNRCAYG